MNVDIPLSLLTIVLYVDFGLSFLRWMNTYVVLREQSKTEKREQNTTCITKRFNRMSMNSSIMVTSSNSLARLPSVPSSSPKRPLYALSLQVEIAKSTT